MPYRTKVAIIYLLGFFIDLLNMFIATVAYPDIAQALDASVAELAWITNAYIVGLTIVIPLSVWLAHAYGGKRILIISLALFLLATIGAGNADSIGALIGWRFFQGLGGGLLIPVGQTLAYQLYRSNERATLTSVVMLVGLLAPALSPALGGAIVETLTWRWIFLLNIPLALATLFLAAAWLKPEQRPALRPPLDLSGLIFGSASIILILLGLTALGDPDRAATGLAILASGLITLSLYVWNSRAKEQPILTLHLIKDPLLKISMLIYLFIPGVFMGVSLIAMIYLQTLLGMSAMHTGMLMLPWAAAAFLAIVLTGRIFNRVGPRPLFLFGALAQGTGILLLLPIEQPIQMAPLIAAYMLMGFGGSLASSAAQTTAFVQMPQANLSQASALWNINRQISFAVGTALLSVLLNLLLTMNGVDDLNDAQLHEQAVHAFRTCFAVAGISALIPIILGLRIKNAAIVQRLQHPTHLKKETL